MNAAQSKNLINAARNVLAILPADTDQTLAQLLAAIEAAEAKPAAKKSTKPRKGDYPANDPRRIGESSAEYFARVMEGFKARTADGWRRPHYGHRKSNIREDGPKIDFAALREALSLCACGHEADDHHKDELDNLLACASCDACSHFHYSVEEAA